MKSQIERVGQSIHDDELNQPNLSNIACFLGEMGVSVIH